jgi:hypothetical protein
LAQQLDAAEAMGTASISLKFQQPAQGTPVLAMEIHRRFMLGV